MKKFSLFLAGFEIQIRMEGCSPWPELERRFRPFLSAPRQRRIPSMRHHWTVAESLRTVPNGDRRGRVILPTLAVRGRKATVRHPNYRGSFDLISRSGRAHVSPTFPAFSSLVRGFLATTLPLDSGLILHAAGILPRGGKAIIFPGASGSGKTTTARHFLADGRGHVILSDELVVVRSSPRPRAWGTPFWGDLRSSIDPSSSRNNVSAPIRQLVFLEKGTRNERRPLSEAEIAKRLLKCTLLHTRSKPVLTGALSAAQALSHSCPAELLVWKSLDYLRATTERLVSGKMSGPGKTMASL